MEWQIEEKTDKNCWMHLHENFSKADLDKIIKELDPLLHHCGIKQNVQHVIKIIRFHWIWQMEKFREE